MGLHPLFQRLPPGGKAGEEVRAADADKRLATDAGKIVRPELDKHPAAFLEGVFVHLGEEGGVIEGAVLVVGCVLEGKFIQDGFAGQPPQGKPEGGGIPFLGAGGRFQRPGEPDQDQPPVSIFFIQPPFFQLGRQLLFGKAGEEDPPPESAVPFLAVFQPVFPVLAVLGEVFPPADAQKGFFNRRFHLPGVKGLDNIAAGPILDCFGGIAEVFVAGEEDKFALQFLFPHPPQQVQPQPHRHFNVADNQFGRLVRLFDQPDGAIYIVRFPGVRKTELLPVDFCPKCPDGGKVIVYQ